MARSLGTHLEHLAADAQGEYLEPGVAIVHRSLHVTPEDAHSSLPHRSRRGRVIAWDGRLDNRADVLLQLPREQRGPLSDAGIALALYEERGLDALASLLGDWSAVIWDPGSRQLVMASDFAATRALYFAAQADHVFWSTSLRALLHLTRRTEVSPRFATGFLTGTVPASLTAYAHIRAVPPAQAVTIDRTGRIEVRRFWEFAAGDVREADTRNYADTCRRLVSESLRARLRSSRPVWAELSGGLDSSTIVCVANAVIKSAAPLGVNRLHAISCSSDRAPDERQFVREVERTCAVAVDRFKIEDCDDLVDAASSWISPMQPRGAVLREYRIVAAAGGRVILSGHPGDLVFGNTAEDAVAIMEAACQGRLLGALHQARRWSDASQRTIWSIAGEALRWSLPPRLQLRQRQWAALGTDHGHRGRRLEAAIASRFLIRADAVAAWQDELHLRLQRACAVAPPWKSRLAGGLINLCEDRTFQTHDDLGVSVTYPFMHRPLLAFLLALPAGVVNGPGEPRLLMRRAFHDLLPRRVVERIGKGRMADPFRRDRIRRFAAIHASNIPAMQVVQRGFVDPAAIKRELEAIQVSGVGALKNLLEVIRLESWLTALDRHRFTAIDVEDSAAPVLVSSRISKTAGAAAR